MPIALLGMKGDHELLAGWSSSADLASRQAAARATAAGSPAHNESACGRHQQAGCGLSAVCHCRSAGIISFKASSISVYVRQRGGCCLAECAAACMFWLFKRLGGTRSCASGAYRFACHLSYHKPYTTRQCTSWELSDHSGRLAAANVLGSQSSLHWLEPGCQRPYEALAKTWYALCWQTLCSPW